MNSKKQWLLIVILLAIATTIFVFADIVTCPWNCMMSFGLDSMKNSLVYLHHAQYGHGFWSNVMNYPYGEHIVFMDGFPLLSVFFATFCHVTPEVALTAMWWFIGLSFILSIVYIYLTLSYFNIKPEFAIVFSVLTTIMSPQIFRVEAHYSLSIFCIIPMIFYWSIKFHATRLRIYAVYVSIAGLMASFVHPYFSGIVFLWCALYALGYIFCTKGKIWVKIKSSAPLFLAGVIAFLIFGITIKMTDPVKDRPVLPYGTLVYLSDFTHITTSGISSIWALIGKSSPTMTIAVNSEGLSYIGLVTEIVLLCSIVTGIALLFKKKREQLLVQEGLFSPIWFFIAITLLIFSFGIPFIWHLEWMLDYLSVFRQFRSIGRFSWIFYYVSNIYIIIVLNNWYIKLRKKKFGIFFSTTLILTASIIWIFETTGYISFVQGLAKTGKTYYSCIYSTQRQNCSEWLKERHFKITDFQAIFTLPLVNIGTDKYAVGENGLWGMSMAEAASLQLNLPLVDALISRSSWSQSRKQLKLISGPYTDKPMFKDLQSDKPFLLFHFMDNQISQDDKYLLQAADSLGVLFDCGVYAYYPKRQEANDKKWQDSIKSILPKMVASDTCLSSDKNLFIEHFNNSPCAEANYGKGAKMKSAFKDSVIINMDIKPDEEFKYEFSCWFLYDKNTFLCPEVYFRFYDSLNSNILTLGLNGKTSTDNNDLWSRASLCFDMPANTRKLKVWIKRVPEKDYVIVDEVMLRKINSIVISKLDDGKIMVNNHWLKKE